MSGVEGAREWSAQLRKTASDIGPEVEKTVFKASMNIKRQLVSEMGRSRSFKVIVPDIDFDMKVSGGQIVSEIGPRSGRGNVGALANIAYFGGARGGGTVPDPLGALETEIPNLEKFLEAIIVKGLQ